ncbi:NAD(P)H:quinone oxidoreductase [Wenzhouxiangella sp. AB-CW3]|uniref:NAD(P)H:quinone oxidoreductase n=1 Tax=Wenzhouxiangella sp. AB-CW3 TaxID=2771012 RepID=UPI00168C0506|nr:NAD(P)H:quinone oxidoreductase [Wenzhouxiangella sp. AB-CW3]QOC22988.1 NAD(P)H:quinone oxidoreductase [Wenzhouxiangella sp. AB-CW3]
MIDILVLFHSTHGNTLAMAREVCRGIDGVDGCQARLRTVPPVTSAIDPSPRQIDERAPALVERSDLDECSGLVLGSPTRFGNMAAALKHFIDGTGSEWFSGTLAGKPAGVFTSTATLHGGQESTLLSMMVPLLHHGMILVGLPYTEPELTTTRSGGTPYGASHVAGPDADRALDDTERHLCRVLGRRVASLARKLRSTI